MDKLVLIVLLCKVKPLLGLFNISNILRPGYDPASLPSDLVNVQVGTWASKLIAVHKRQEVILSENSIKDIISKIRPNLVSFW